MTKSNRSVRMTREELETILEKNKGLKISAQTPLKEIIKPEFIRDSGSKKIEKDEAIKEFFSKKKTKLKVDDFFLPKSHLDTSIASEPEIQDKQETKAKKTKGINVKESIIEFNKKCEIEVAYDTNYLSIIFKNCRLLSLNQIFAILQFRKYEIFSYKKMWQELISNALQDKKDLPFFDKNCEIVLLRKSVRLVDRDSLGPMYKYIIDALKEDKKTQGKIGVLSEDNPNVVESIKLLQYKSREHIVGVRIQRIKPQDEQEVSVEEFLGKNTL